MRELVFALEFKGTAGPVPDTTNRLRAKTSASDQTLRTVLKPYGLQIGIERSGPDAATFESEVEIVGEGAFLESGTITYGAGGKVTFKTVGQGVLGPSPISGAQRGAVIWEVTGGEGVVNDAGGISPTTTGKSATSGRSGRTEPSTTGFTTSRWDGLKARTVCTLPLTVFRSAEKPLWYFTSPEPCMCAVS